MKGILIDVHQQCVRPVEVNDKEVLQSMYRHIGCECVDRVSINERDDIWVDDEGLLTMDEDSKFFVWRGYGQPLCGNGLILGVNREGECVDPCITIDEVRTKVQFYNMSEIQVMMML
jgi:hypothetical protein